MGGPFGTLGIEETTSGVPGNPEIPTKCRSDSPNSEALAHNI